MRPPAAAKKTAALFVAAARAATRWGAIFACSVVFRLRRFRG
jgi:hypothetical protein